MRLSPSSRSFFFIFLLLAQVFFYGLRWWKSDPMTSDFPYFYVVGRLYQSGQQPYNLEAQCEFQARLRTGECAGYSHTPILLPVLGVLFSNDFYVSYFRWSMVECVLLLACFVLLMQISKDVFASAQSCLFPPLIVSMWFGNDTLFILTAILSWALLLLKKKDFWAGICLSLVVLKPQLAIPLAVPLLFVRPKAFVGFVIGGFTLTLYSFAIVGMEGFRGIFNITRDLSVGHTFGGVSQRIMFNTSAILVRLGMSVFWAWPIYLGAIVGLSWYLKRYGVTLFTISLAVLVMIFTSPHLFFYDLSYMALPLVSTHPLAPAVGSIIASLTLIGAPGWTIYLMMIALAFILSKKVTHEQLYTNSALANRVSRL